MTGSLGRRPTPLLTPPATSALKRADLPELFGPTIPTTRCPWSPAVRGRRSLSSRSGARQISLPPPATVRRRPRGGTALTKERRSSRSRVGSRPEDDEGPWNRALPGSAALGQGGRSSDEAGTGRRSERRVGAAIIVLLGISPTPLPGDWRRPRGLQLQSDPLHGGRGGRPCLPSASRSAPAATRSPPRIASSADWSGCRLLDRARAPWTRRGALTRAPPPEGSRRVPGAPRRPQDAPGPHSERIPGRGELPLRSCATPSRSEASPPPAPRHLHASEIQFASGRRAPRLEPRLELSEVHRPGGVEPPHRTARRPPGERRPTLGGSDSPSPAAGAVRMCAILPLDRR